MPKENPSQNAPLKVALAVAGASAIIMATLVAVVIWNVWRLSRVSRLPPPDPRAGHKPHGMNRPWDNRIIDLGNVIPLVIFLAVVAVVLVGIIAWIVTKRANAPLHRALQIQRAFVADASHELRTPLTTLNSRIQLAQHRLTRGGDVESALADARKDAQIMDNVLRDLLTSAETSALASDTFSNVSDVVAGAIHLTEVHAKQAGVSIRETIPEPLEVRGEHTAVVRALVALVNNAIAHSEPGTSVTVDVRRNSGFVEFRVIDEGSGIASQNPERLFERFARDDQDSNKRGFGLGLALVRDIATRFKGTVILENTSPQGSTFLLKLPGK